jgi:hypothetical protein
MMEIISQLQLPLSPLPPAEAPLPEAPPPGPSHVKNVVREALSLGAVFRISGANIAIENYDKLPETTRRMLDACAASGLLGHTAAPTRLTRPRSNS